MIPQQFIEEVQSRSDIVEVISGYIPLKRTGRNFKALCPFHSEKTPSFIISHQKQIFHCFGCGEGGGVFQFIMLMEKVTFPEAVEMLAKRLGLPVPYQKGSASKTKDILYEAMNEATALFQANLKDNREYQSVQAYLRKRGIGPETIDTFHLGYAGPNNFLLSHMRKKGFTLEVLEKASLVTSSERGFRDLFCHRIMFPIFDVRSRIVGFGARLSKESADSPKYINSLENQLYSKRNVLYGLNFSKEDIVRQGVAIVVEGYLDMIVPFMRGIKNIVASLGTALTFEQIRLLKRYASKIILVYDSDKAGQMATLRSLDLILESDLKAEVAILPSGYDPDSLVRKQGKDSFLSIIDKRCDFFEYKLNILCAEHDRESIEGKTKIAQNMLLTIDKLNSEIEKYEYIKRLASHLDVKEEIMIAEFQNIASKKAPLRRQIPDSLSPSGDFSAKKEPLPVTEKVLVKYMVTSPKAFALIRKNLKEEYFSSKSIRRAVSFLLHAYPDKEPASAQALLGAINDKEIAGFISCILMDDSTPVDKNLFRESLCKLRKKGIQELKKALQSKIKEAEAKGDKERVKQLIDEYSKVQSSTA
jgi:DNA primase